MEKTFEVKGMSCVICKNTVETGIKKIKGVKDCKVNLIENEATIIYDETIVNEFEIAKVVSNLGYKLIIHKTNDIDLIKYKLIISIILVIVLMYFSMGPMIGFPIYSNSKLYQLILATIIIFLNINYFISGIKALIHLYPNMDTLVSLSSGISYIFSLISFNKLNSHLYFETSSMVLVIVSIGKYIEGKNKNKITKTIRGLATLIPMQANLVVDNEVKIVSIDDIKIDDIVEIKPGESVPQDGIIIKGSSTLDESMITGESLPQNKAINDNVIGGTININGTIRVKITKNANQSTVSKIISLTKSATLSKIPIERLTDKVSKYFVYVVILISVITFVVWYSFTKNTELALNFSLSVLVISCPCALGLATPSAIMVAIGNCARNAILIKNPRVLEIIGKIKYIILDKTGTLTKNKLEIVDIQEYSNEFINVLSSLEKLSNHPIANTILDKYNDGDIIFDKFEQISSEGIVGYLNNDLYFAGNSKLASKYVSIQNNNINDDYSYIIVGKNDTLLGVIYISDILRPSSMVAIDRLKKMNIIPIMCTGDKESIAKQISKKLQINQYVSSVKPEDKNALVIEKKKQGIVGMVGDGINDAIALSSADVSISLANATDIATSTSDILLMGNDINDIPFLINVSKKTIRIIKQNLFWALFYNSIFIPLAAGVFYNSYGLILNPMIGAATMCISSIIVLTNALRINSIKKEELITMNKTISIEGMMCNNCARHVKEALEALGANVNVVLEENKAYLENTSLSDEQIKDAITTAGYTVTEIKNG